MCYDEFFIIFYYLGVQHNDSIFTNNIAKDFYELIKIENAWNRY